MGEYDITLKGVLQRLLSGSVLAELSGLEVCRWHNVEFPDVSTRHVDLLGEASDGRLVHIELQSRNEAGMGLRMLEYAVAIRKRFERFPEQTVLYVGNQPLRMEMRLEGPRLSFDCRLVDIRDLDGARLLESERLEDNVIAILARLGDERAAIRRVLAKIAASEPRERGVALAELMLLAGLRRVGGIIEQEARQMPILDDIMDHEVLGREYRRGLRSGEVMLTMRLAEKRFGPLPQWAKDRIEAMDTVAAENAAIRLLDAASLEDLFA